MSKKDCLKLAHDLLDEELQKDSKIGTKFSSSRHTVKHQINDLEKKLNNLEKKMQNIDVGSNQEEQKEDSLENKINYTLGRQHSGKKQINLWKDEQEEEDSENEDNIYAKIEERKKKKIIEKPILKQIEDKKQNVYIPKTYSREKSKQKKSNNLRNSLRSLKSHKSNHSNVSRKSIDSKKSLSVKSSQYSERQKIRNLELQNTKDIKKMSNLQKELNHFKRLTRKLQEKVEDYRVMEIQFRKLQSNFAKSEQIRKQQKKIIQNLKKN